ncbi:MAG: lysine-sensitive aspartokinase 3 [Halobacteriovoraceae bacterium]|nr:lysine-sensitive aspartokinase 3 [Halobacteriovoraceae bacterium]
MSKIIVSKFGGSSMKDQEAMLRSAKICQKQKSTITLVSATYGTTDKLHELVNNAVKGNWNECEKLLFTLREKHFDILQNLTNDKLVGERLRELINNLETLIRGIFLISECSPKAHDRVVSFGERLSSLLFCEAMKMTIKDKPVELFDSRDILKTNNQFGRAKPNIQTIHHKCQNYFKLDGSTTYVGQGYIGSTDEGSTTTLGRGGSDYSAALFAEGVRADVLEIWTDVAGIATCDPRICENTKPIEEISYNEAGEMAHYGAKILHPTTLVPAMRQSIPVFVGSSYASEELGTWIRHEVEQKPLIRAIAKRDNQALLTITTPKMLDAFGFMSKIFAVFTEFEVSVDCVTTSEISVAVSLDPKTLDNKELIQKLAQIGEVKTEYGFSLISLIGNKMLEQAGLAKRVFAAIEDINVRMLCLGASPYNFNILVTEKESNDAIGLLHKEFIA